MTMYNRISSQFHILWNSLFGEQHSVKLYRIWALDKPYMNNKAMRCQHSYSLQLYAALTDSQSQLRYAV